MYNIRAFCDDTYIHYRTKYVESHCLHLHKLFRFVTYIGTVIIHRASPNTINITILCIRYVPHRPDEGVSFPSIKSVMIEQKKKKREREGERERR